MIFLVIGILLVLAGLLFATVLREHKGLIAVAAIVPDNAAPLINVGLTK